MNVSNFSMCDGFGSASAKDIVDLLHVDDAASEVAFDDPAEDEIRTWEGDLFLTAWENDRFAGFGRARKDGWVTHVFVRPEYRLQGLGTQILSKLEARLRVRGKRTALLSAEPNAVEFFRANGWNSVEPIDVLAKEPLEGRRLLLIPMRKTISE